MQTLTHNDLELESEGENQVLFVCHVLDSLRPTSPSPCTCRFRFPLPRLPESPACQLSTQTSGSPSPHFPVPVTARDWDELFHNRYGGSYIVSYNLVHKVNCKLSIWQLFSRCKRWRTDIRHCRNDFLCWRTDALAKRPACLQKNGSARHLPSRTNSWTEDFSVTPAERVSKKWLAVLVNRSVNVV